MLGRAKLPSISLLAVLLGACAEPVERAAPVDALRELERCDRAKVHSGHSTGRLCPYGTLSLGVAVPTPLAFLEPDARGVRWEQDHPCPEPHVELLRFTDEWVAIVAELETDDATRYWIRPVEGWRRGGVYRVGVRYMHPLPIFSGRSYYDPVEWTEVGIRERRAQAVEIRRVAAQPRSQHEVASGMLRALASTASGVRGVLAGARRFSAAR